MHYDYVAPTQLLTILHALERGTWKDVCGIQGGVQGVSSSERHSLSGLSSLNKVTQANSAQHTYHALCPKLYFPNPPSSGYSIFGFAPRRVGTFSHGCITAPRASATSIQ